MSDAAPKLDTTELIVDANEGAEIFLIDNDRMLVAKAVGQLRTVVPKGSLYRLKVTRVGISNEQIIEVTENGHFKVFIDLESPVAITARELDDTAVRKLDDYVADNKQAGIVLVCKEYLGEDATPSPAYSLFTNNSTAVTLADRSGISSSKKRQLSLQISSSNASPGFYFLEISAGSVKTRFSLPVLDGWQTRVFISNKLKSSLSPEVKQTDSYDVAVYLTRPDRPLALDNDGEAGEVVRWALMAARPIIQNSSSINAYLDADRADPLSAIAAAFLFLDFAYYSKTGDQPAASKQLDENDSAALTRLFQQLDQLMPFGTLPDLVALKLYANTPLAGIEQIVSAPPLLKKSWEVLFSATKNPDSGITILPKVYQECPASFTIGPYFCWTPVNVARYLEVLIEANERTIKEWVLPEVEKRATSALEAAKQVVADKIKEQTGHQLDSLTGSFDLKKELGSVPWRSLIKKIGHEAGVAASELTGIRTAEDLAKKITTLSPTITQAIGQVAGTVHRNLPETISVLNDQNNRHVVADKLGVPRAMLDALVPSAVEPAMLPAPNIRQARAPAATASISDVPDIPQPVRDLILAMEVGDQNTYENLYSAPSWRRANTGVTIGIGYDLAGVTKTDLYKDWGALLAADALATLESAVGMRGDAARTMADKLGDSVKIPWDAALSVFDTNVIPAYTAATLKALPNLSRVSHHSLGALVSLSMDKGKSYSRAGDAFREMRAIKSHVAHSRFDHIANEIRAMERLDDRDVERRQQEASLFEIGLLHSYTGKT
jgi:hypothetical protein